MHIYSRNSEDNTSKYPDIIRRMPKVLGDGIKSCVVDSEAVAWDVEKKQILPFQVLSTRKRKVLTPPPLSRKKKKKKRKLSTKRKCNWFLIAFPVGITECCYSGFTVWQILIILVFRQAPFSLCYSTKLFDLMDNSRDRKRQRERETAEFPLSRTSFASRTLTSSSQNKKHRDKDRPN